MSPYPRLKMCISTQSRSHLKPIQVSRFVSHLIPLPGSQIHVSSLSPLNLTSILFLIFASRLHPGPPNCILVPSKHHLKPIPVSRWVSHLHTGPFPTVELYLSPFLVLFHAIHVSRCASQLQVPSQPHPGLDICVSSPPRPPDPRFFFVSVESHLNLGPDICI